ncbi:hypothetical protein [Dyadobacter sp. LHD-138]|nr:hypothetical protein [Dyadobacter sp. LHD-138]MDQ6481638.1 hypothetical protein [Dyadobacter sp. LHD-138]
MATISFVPMALDRFDLIEVLRVGLGIRWCGLLGCCCLMIASRLSLLNA